MGGILREGGIARGKLYGINYYLYGEAYLGSHKGMRYRIAREPLRKCVFDNEEKARADSPVLRVSVWPEPFCYEKTPEGDIKNESFEFSAAGLDAACEWLNDIYSEQFSQRGPESGESGF